MVKSQQFIVLGENVRNDDEKDYVIGWSLKG